MPKLLANTRADESTHHIDGGLRLGIAWGGCAGAVIGTGVSLTIGLFYSSAGLLIFSVITVSAILGALFGYVMASLLADDVAFTGHALHAYPVVAAVAAPPPPSDHRTLRLSMLSNQSVMASINAVRAQNTKLPPYPMDTRIFELVVARAHTTKAESGFKEQKVTF